MVGFTVEGLEVGERAGILWHAELRDPTGRRIGGPEAPAIGGSGVDETDLSAYVQTWWLAPGGPALVAGTWELTVTSDGGMNPGICTVGALDPECASPRADGMIDSTWRFEFELPKPTGTVVSADVSDTEGQATVTLTELRVSPTMITGRIALRVAGSTVAYWLTDDGSWWSTNGSLRHGGTSYTFGYGYHVAQDPQDQGPNGDEFEFNTIAGSDEATGTWEIEIPELWYVSGDGGPETAIHLTGPWTLTVTVP